MEVLNQWRTAIAVNGDQIKVKLIPLKRQQSTNDGFIWVEVGQMVELESGETIEMNLDGSSFYVGQNLLYRLK